ncbi:MAG: glycosyltransferase family 4 protein [Chitinophagales bacterium]|nr:glycosyltransferase family 4 protein [Chitinophagales bacterium]
MPKKKIKVFLGGYINSINAQNLNCRALAQHLDKSNFQVLTLSLYSGSLPSITGARTFRCFWPHKLSAYMGYLWGIWNADVVYLPKQELVFWNQCLIKLFGKVSFTTLEGVIDGTNLDKALSFYHSTERMRSTLEHFTRVFSITAFMRKKNWELHRFTTQEKILCLGVDISVFTSSAKKKLSEIVLIGNNLKHKGWEDYMALAYNFPELQFHVVGTGNGFLIPEEEVRKKNLENVSCHGLLNHHSLNELLQQIQLLVFPSRSEGFPKVTLEAACAGVPSLVYSDYGAEEWITHNKNGFVVDTLDEMKETISRLQKEQEKLSAVSKSAVELGKSFDWSKKVKDWEQVIEQLAKA